MIFRNIKNIKKLFKESYYLSFSIIVFSTLFLSTLEFISIGSIPLFISFLLNSKSNLILYDKFDLSNFLPDDNSLQVILFGSLITLIFFIKNLLWYFFYIFKGKFLMKLKLILSKNLFGQYLDSPYSLIIEQNPSIFLRNLMSEVDSSVNYIEFIGLFIKEIFLILTILILLIIFNTKITLSILLIFSLISLIFYLLVQKKIKKISIENMKLRSEKVKLINEVFGSIKETKIFNAINYFKNEFLNMNREIERIFFSLNIINKIPKLFFEVLAVIGLIILTIIIFLNNNDLISIIPFLSLVTLAILRLLPSFNSLTTILYRLNSLSVSFDHLINEIEKFKSSKFLPEYKKNHLKKINHFLEVKNLNFKYPNSKNFILKNISFRINKGQIVGLIGTSGSGKTTLIDVLIGLLEPTTGQVLVDGELISNNKINLVRDISYIPQSAFLLDDTIKKNIAFGQTEDEINRNKINESIKLARLDDFVDDLNDKENTFVGNQGVKLSGGQRQRIGIARAVYNESDVMAMDEITSSVDYATEKELMNEIYKFKGKKTIIISAHRIHTLKNCDKILYLDNGYLKYEGTYNEVIKKIDMSTEIK